MTQTGMELYETLSASSEVITARAEIIQAAFHSPATIDQAELGRMVPEKVDAFSRAGSVMVSAWWTGHAAWMGQVQHLGTMASRGRPPTLMELADLANRTASYTLQSIEANSKLGSDSLAPVHRGAIANAHRLRRKGEPAAANPDHVG